MSISARGRQAARSVTERPGRQEMLMSPRPDAPGGGRTRADVVVRPPVNHWVVAPTVTLATFMEVLDASIANVALPHTGCRLSAGQGCRRSLSRADRPRLRGGFLVLVGPLEPGRISLRDRRSPLPADARRRVLVRSPEQRRRSLFAQKPDQSSHGPLQHAAQ
jgi:hypothetical protein